MLLLETVGINVPRACPRGRKIAPGFPKPSALVIFSGCMAAAIRPPMGYGNLQDASGLCPQAGKIGVRQTQKGLLVLLRHAGNARSSVAATGAAFSSTSLRPSGVRQMCMSLPRPG